MAYLNAGTNNLQQFEVIAYPPVFLRNPDKSSEHSYRYAETYPGKETLLVSSIRNPPAKAIASSNLIIEEQRYLLWGGCLHFVVVGLGVILLSVFGITITGGVLVAWELFCSITSFALLGYFKLNTLQKAKFAKTIYPGSLNLFPNVYSVIIAIALVLAAATAIHGLVVVVEISLVTPSFFYNGAVIFRYIGLGAANMALGIAAVVIDICSLRTIIGRFHPFRSGNDQRKDLVVEDHLQELANIPTNMVFDQHETSVSNPSLSRNSFDTDSERVKYGDDGNSSLYSLRSPSETLPAYHPSPSQRKSPLIVTQV